MGLDITQIDELRTRDAKFEKKGRRLDTVKRA